MQDINNYPKLIEPGTKYFLYETLKKCNLNKKNLYNTLFNLGLLLIFIFILGMILIYKNNTKMTINDKIKKKNYKQDTYLIKLKNIK